MKVEPNVKLDYSDVLIRPKRSNLSSRSEVCLEREFTFIHSRQTWKGVPIIAANMDTVGTFEMANCLATHKMLTAIHKFYDESDWYEEIDNSDFSVWQNTMISIGSTDADLDKVRKIMDYEKDINFICIDVANGYSQQFVKFVEKARKTFPNAVISAGNVVTREMTESLIIAGADIVKVGIGPGSVCTTRKVAGVGYPQLSAVMECADAAHGMGKAHIIADGGCTTSGDIAKAFGAGADFVMLGGMFAGHDESGGEDVVNEDGVITHKKFYGMSSDTAMNKHYGGIASYRASEGKTVSVPYRGSVSHTVHGILGGIRSACTYVGARNLKSLPKCTTFIRTARITNDVFGSST